MNLIALLSATLTINIIYGGTQSISIDEEICAYQVEVSNAKELPDEDPDILGWFGSQNLNDVYCEVIGYAKGSADFFKSVRTRTIDESETPQWDETFIFANNDLECDGSEYDRVLFKLYDDDTIAGWSAFGALAPQILGQTQVIYFSDVQDCDKEYAMELQVSRDGVDGGTLFVVLSKTTACCSSSSTVSTSTGSSSSGGSKSSGYESESTSKSNGYESGSTSKSSGYETGSTSTSTSKSSGYETGSSSTGSKNEQDDIQKLEEEKKEIEEYEEQKEEEKKVIEEEIKYEEEKEKEEEKYEQEAAVEQVTKGKGSKNKGYRRRLISSFTQ